MLFGKLSGIFIIAAGAVIVTMCIVKPGGGNPLSVLGGLSILFSVPVSFMFGIIGVIFDKRKWLAITTTVVSAGFILFYICMMVFVMVLHS